jgi:hypothetical protein
MKPNSPTRKAIVSLAAVSVCALVIPAVAALKNQVTRPVKVNGTMILKVKPSSENPGIGSYTFTDWGQASHAGSYTDTASGTINLVTGEFLSGTGTIVAANGDSITWEVTATEDPNDTPNVVVYTGGTGRFQGVSGGFVAEVTPASILGVDADGTLTLSLTYTGRGEITY